MWTQNPEAGSFAVALDSWIEFRGLCLGGLPEKELKLKTVVLPNTKLFLVLVPMVVVMGDLWLWDGGAMASRPRLPHRATWCSGHLFILKRCLVPLKQIPDVLPTLSFQSPLVLLKLPTSRGLGFGLQTLGSIANCGAKMG